MSAYGKNDYDVTACVALSTERVIFVPSRTVKTGSRKRHQHLVMVQLADLQRAALHPVWLEARALV